MLLSILVAKKRTQVKSVKSRLGPLPEDTDSLPDRFEEVNSDNSGKWW